MAEAPKPTKKNTAAPAPQVAPPQPAPAPAPVADTGIDWGAHSGPTGFENVSQDDFGVPFLSICQKGSPEVDPTAKDHIAKRIPGIAVGDVFATTSRQIVHHYGAGPLLFVPAGYNKAWVEWKTRESGGGFVKSHTSSAITKEITGRNDKGQDMLRNGNVLVTTAYFFGYVISENEEPKLVVINLVSTQLKHAREWLNMMQSIKVGPNRITPPMYSHHYLLSTTPESNAKGSWMGWKIQVGDQVKDRDLVQDCAKVCAQVAAPDGPKLLGPSSPAATTESDDVPM